MFEVGASNLRSSVRLAYYCGVFVSELLYVVKVFNMNYLASHHIIIIFMIIYIFITCYHSGFGSEHRESHCTAHPKKYQI